MLTQNSAALEAQLEERPLARQQERLQDEADGDAEKATEEAAAEGDRKGKGKERADGAEDVTTRTQSHTPEKHARKALLKNDDYELQRLSGVSAALGWLLLGVMRTNYFHHREITVTRRGPFPVFQRI